MKESSKGGARRRRRIGSTGGRLLVVALVAALPEAAGGSSAVLAANTGHALPDLGVTDPALSLGYDYGDAFFDVPPVPNTRGLDSPAWRLESQSTQLTELSRLTRPAPTAMRPFSVAASVVIDPAQNRLAFRLLHAAPHSVRGLAPGPQAIKALAFAMSQIGKPYLWGGTGPRAYDCSGLMQQSYRYAGIAVPRTSREQATIGVPVRLADLLPGDMLFFAHDVHDASTIHHVAMYAGDGLVVHAPQTGELVHLSPLWLTEYIGAVRMVPAVGKPLGAGELPAPGFPIPVTPPTSTKPGTPKPGTPKPPPTSEPPTSTPPSDPPTSSAPPTSEPPTSTPPTDPPTSSEPPPSDPAPTDPPTSSEPPSDPPSSTPQPSDVTPSDSGSAAPSDSGSPGTTP